MVLRHRRSRLIAVATLSVVALAGAACSKSSASPDGANCSTPAESPVVTLAAYSNVYDTYGKLISAFQSDWKDKHDGQSVQFLTSFGGSTTQAQAVVNGLQADIVALSLDPDVQTIQDAGLITHDWKNDPDGSIVATGAVDFDVRKGDVAINYDYAVQADSATKDGTNEMVVPPSTVAIQTPTVVVDKNAKAHCVQGIANAFVIYLRTPDAQDVFQTVGLERPIDVKAAQKGTDDEPAVQDYFTTDDIGGWDQLEKDTVFGPDGAFTKAYEEAQG